MDLGSKIQQTHVIQTLISLNIYRPTIPIRIKPSQVIWIDLHQEKNNKVSRVTVCVAARTLVKIISTLRAMLNYY